MWLQLFAFHCFGEPALCGYLHPVLGIVRGQPLRTVGSHGFTVRAGVPPRGARVKCGTKLLRIWICYDEP